MALEDALRDGFHAQTDPPVSTVWAFSSKPPFLTFKLGRRTSPASLSHMHQWSPWPPTRDMLSFQRDMKPVISSRASTQTYKVEQSWSGH
ncbi:hypothetical protein GOP47_0019880 [Adiantum capillus-veneris]|uniref:Uncharacterized protein n=1 Tax=Adiantum capillus-veneris TaxID=13818 RepID=A0A9D4Z8W3_ADICA|nr:hypothetical protein GOP47_0019880 [Adiantum capillus-veneris]